MILNFYSYFSPIGIHDFKTCIHLETVDNNVGVICNSLNVRLTFKGLTLRWEIVFIVARHLKGRFFVFFTVAFLPFLAPMGPIA